METANHTWPVVAEMTDLQLLTYLLTLVGARETDARSTAHALLDTYNDLSTILTLPSSTLLGDPRLKRHAASFLALVGAMSFRYANRFRRSKLTVMDSETVRSLLAPCLQGLDTERVCAICVDRDFHLLGSGAVVTRGEANSVALPIRRLLALALDSDAYGLILAHNHPDGQAQFSLTDLMTTDVLRGKLAALGVSLLDHYLWVSDTAVSLHQLLHSVDSPPPLDRWDRTVKPLLSRLDPALFSSVGPSRRNPFLFSEQTVPSSFKR